MLKLELSGDHGAHGDEVMLELELSGLMLLMALPAAGPRLQG